MTQPAKRTRLEKGEKRLTLGGVLAMGLILGIGWNWWDINRLPEVQVPAPVLPVPNAHDQYLKAADTLVWEEGLRFHDAIRYGELPSLDPAHVPQTRTEPATDPPLTLEELRAGVRQNRPAMDLLRAGFEYAYREPPFRSFNHRFPHFGKYRQILYLLAADGYVQARDGDWPGAADCYLDAMELGATCGHGGPWVGGLVGIAITAIGRGELWHAVEHLDAAAAQEAARRLEGMLAKQPALAETLEEEKWTGQAALMELFKLPRNEMADPVYETDTPTTLQRIDLYIFSKRGLMRDYTAQMDAMIAEAGKPYAARRELPPLRDSLTVYFLIPFDKAGFRWTAYNAYNRLLLTMLALRAYRETQGEYPAALADLCPRYLSAVPDDPFALGGPLQYRKTGETYLLYSVGPDGVDDGGAPSADGQRPSGGKTPGKGGITADSRGDMVAGVNLK